MNILLAILFCSFTLACGQELCWRQRYIFSKGRIPNNKENWEDCYHPCQKQYAGYHSVDDCSSKLVHCAKRFDGQKWRCVLKSIDSNGRKINVAQQYRPKIVESPPSPHQHTSHHSSHSEEHESASTNNHEATKTTPTASTTKATTTQAPSSSEHQHGSHKHIQRAGNQKQVLNRFSNLFGKFGHNFQVVEKPKKITTTQPPTTTKPRTTKKYTWTKRPTTKPTTTKRPTWAKKPTTRPMITKKYTWTRRPSTTVRPTTRRYSWTKKPAWSKRPTPQPATTKKYTWSKKQPTKKPYTTTKKYVWIRKTTTTKPPPTTTQKPITATVYRSSNQFSALQRFAQLFKGFGHNFRIVRQN